MTCWAHPWRILLAACAALLAADAAAVPSFARQTGLDCNECHFSFPELTAAGRRFKLGGYVLSGAEPDVVRPLVSFDFDGPPPVVPVAVQALLSDTALRQSIPADAQGDYARVNSPYLQEASIFLNGQIAGPVGCFCQWTYDGTSRRVQSDDLDLRAAREVAWGQATAIFGLSLNNNPTVTDIYNTTPAWAWPYAASGVAPGPVAAPLIAGGLQGSVAGLTGYGLVQKSLYAEFGVYRRADQALRVFALGIPGSEQTVVDGAAPYYRIALQREWQHARHSAEIGAFGLSADTVPALPDLRGAVDHSRDLGLDAQYQYVTDQHRFSGQATWVHEVRRLDASFAARGASYSDGYLNEWTAKASYYFRRRYGVSVGIERLSGSADLALYGGATPVTGSRNGSPDTDALIGELDYVFSIAGRPDHQTFRLVAQYRAYRRFNGGTVDYDGYGRGAGANNTLYLLLRALY